jgi:hypothetical protein
MTGDETEREKRKQYLKDLLRTQRAMRQHLQAVRRPQWLQDIYLDGDLRWEAERELDAEEAAAQRRQLEAEVQQEAAPDPKLRVATADEVRDVLRAINKRYTLGAAPNLAEIYPLARAELEKLGLTATKQFIQDIAAEKEFAEMRGQQGKRRT